MTSPQDPIYAGRCNMCGGPLPNEPDPRVTRSRQRSICSRNCENKQRHRRDYARDDPESHRAQTCERKPRYPDRASAEQAIASGQRWRRPVRPYECEYCDGWHIGGY